MKPSFSILFLTWTFQNNYGFGLKWPVKYHMKGDYLNFDTEIVKPFEVWLKRWSDGQYVCRLDFYNGMLRNYYARTEDPNNKNELVSTFSLRYPKINRNGDPIVGCCNGYTNETYEQGVKTTHLNMCFLPSLEDFYYAGQEIHRGKRVQIWKKNYVYLDDQRVYRSVQEMQIYRRTRDEMIIPIRFTTKVFNMLNGGVQSYSIVTYDVFDKNVSDEDLMGYFSVENSEKKAANKINRYQKRETDSPDTDGLNKNKGKKYFEIRKKIIQDNWKFINEHNSKNLSYKLSLNKFADRTPKELQFLFGTLDTTRDDLEQEGTLIFPHTAEEIEEIASGLPENFDLKLRGFISRVKNQGLCSSCWAFAAADTVAGALSRSHGGLLLDLSVQSLMDCVWPYTSNTTNNTTGGCIPIRSISYVFNYIFNHGIPTTMDYGLYLEEAGICKLKYVKSLFTIKNFVRVPLEANFMRVAIYKYGPLMITIRINITTMLYYTKGIYFEEKGANNTHAVTIVGYGVDSGVPYWIAKNSWGENWGLGGYMRISASDKHFPVIVDAYYVIV